MRGLAMGEAPEVLVLTAGGRDDPGKLLVKWTGPHLPARIDRRTLNRKALIVLVNWDEVYSPRDSGTPTFPHNTYSREQPEEPIP